MCKCLVPLLQPVPEVVKSRYHLIKILGEIGQLRLESAYCQPSLIGQLGAVGAIVGHSAVDIQGHHPVFSRFVLVVGLAVGGSNHREHLMLRVAVGCHHFLAQVVGHAHDVVHHGRHVGKYVLVFALQHIAG